MLGLTFEKLLLVAVVAAVLVGPSRLPGYAERLSRFVRDLRAFVESGRAHVEADLGVTLTRAEWEELRRYDPRHVVREALAEPVVDTVAVDTIAEEARRVRPGQRFLVTGSVAHPVRLRLADLPADDPRRLAAQVPTSDPGTSGAVSTSGG